MMKMSNQNICKRLNAWAVPTVLSLVLLASCGKEPAATPDPDPTTGTPSPTVLRANRFVLDCTYEAYLWDNTLPMRSLININKYFKPDSLFDNKLLYKADDRWSFVTDQAATLSNSLDGKETTFGYSLALGEFSNAPGTYFAVVQFVYPDTPAALAGIRRGDIIMKINAGNITEDNYMKLFNDPSVKLQMGILNEGYLELSSKSYDLAAVEMTLNPVIASKVITRGGQKIGYLCYSDYTTVSKTELAGVLSSFKSAGVSDVVLDLRYNTGGDSDMAQFLSSTLVPEVNLNSVFLRQVWNDGLQDYFTQKGMTDYITIYFDKSVAVNLNLPRVYVLTGRNTASASEATMVGLSPYMNVIKIGETTHGKYTGAIFFEGGDEDELIKNWGLFLVVYRFANADGITDFKNGFTPDYAVDEVLLGDVKQLGDESEELLAKALSLITGTPDSKAVRTAPQPAVNWIENAPARIGDFPKMFSKSDEILGYRRRID
ncbi:MAG: hypothetical protein LBU80_05710 [Rikenellaceae bacterium]|jgi:C-terminal processing protease CtpA/Prc|nr:hypothetical protein [Rikenellaceae bacterium]